MQWSLLLLSASAALVQVQAQAPSYAPIFVDCPSTSLVNRTGSPLNGDQVLYSDEAKYIASRRQVLAPLWRTYLGNDTGYNVSRIVSNQPKIALAVSGGGLRASQYGAGTLSAMQSANSSSLGGLLELSDYLAGLSGGSWVISSIALADMPEIYDLVFGSSRLPGWKLDLDILAPDGLLGISDNKDYYDSIEEDVRAKAATGAPVSLVDIWGRALAMHFFNGTSRANFFDESATKDQGLLYSSIKLTQNFQSHRMPIPLVVSTSRISEADQVSGNSSTVIPLARTQFEFTPFTFGSFDHTLAANIPIEFLGTSLTNGEPANSSQCVNYFDNAGFVIGTSAALFNAIQNEFSSTTFTDLISTLISQISDITAANYSVPLVSNVPSSFYGLQPETAAGTTFESSENRILELTDGGENGENVPIAPLLVRARELDVVFAIDSSADTTYSWPNGTSLLATAERASDFSGDFNAFPPIPASSAEFVAQGLNKRPTFFGCNVTSGNMSAHGTYPIVIYMPNAPPPTVNEQTFFTNTTTLTLNYETDDTVKFLDAAHANALKGWENTTAGEQSDDMWPLCVKCATVDRARQRAGLTRSAACAGCFNKYCWSESIAATLTNITTSTGGTLGTTGGETGDGAGPTGAAVSSFAAHGGLVAVVAAVATLVLV